MYETIILAVCLMQTPSICKEVNISEEPDPAGSLQLPFSLRPARSDGRPEVDLRESHLAH
jgi:hypothetical protein